MTSRGPAATVLAVVTRDRLAALTALALNITELNGAAIVSTGLLGTTNAEMVTAHRALRQADEGKLTERLAVLAGVDPAALTAAVTALKPA
jgi:hypothetical protein